MASAGLRRLSLAHHVTELFDVDTFVPAVGQGVLGLEHRQVDGWLGALLAPLADAATAVAAEAERALLGRLGASCTVPLGAPRYPPRRPGVVDGSRGRPGRWKLFRFKREGAYEEARLLGTSLAEELLRSPAAGILTAPLYAAFDASGVLA